VGLHSSAERSPDGAIRCYVALGDSFTCGLSSVGGPRWADIVARGLGASRYVNLATVGATSRDLEARQLEPALGLEPDLLSLVCGANDVFSSVRLDIGAYGRRLSRMLARIRAAAPSALVLTATYPDPTRFVTMRERTGARVRLGTRTLNDAIREVTAQHGALCLDWARHPEVRRRANFATDGFHPAPALHRAAGEYVLRTIAEVFEDLARAVTGEIVHVHGGFHAFGAPLSDGAVAEAERQAPLR
jgi:lysophospholipase L1-like esterase